MAKKSSWIYFETFDNSIVSEPEVTTITLNMVPFQMYFYSRKGLSGQPILVNFRTFSDIFGRVEPYDNITKKSLQLLLETGKQQYVINLNKTGYGTFTIRLTSNINKSDNDITRTLIGGDIDNNSITYVSQSTVQTNPEQIVNLTTGVDLTTINESDGNIVNRTAKFVYVEAKQSGQYFRDLQLEFKLKQVVGVSSTPTYHMSINIYKLEPVDTYTENETVYTYFKLGQLLESIGGFVSKDIVDEYGNSQYIVDIVNKNSKYINILIPNTVVEQLTNINIPDQEIVITTWETTTDNKVKSLIANTLPEYRKSDNTPEYRHPVFIEDYQYNSTVYEINSLIENFDEVTVFKYFVEGGLSTLFKDTQRFNDYMSHVTELAEELFFVVYRDIPNPSTQITNLDQYILGFTSDTISSFVQFFFPWVVTNKSTNYGGTLTVPPSVYAQIISDNVDNTLGAHVPASGTTQKITDAIDLSYKMKKEQRDLVYELNVNPISKIFDSGIFIWGNKTAYDKNSKLRSLNVRRMINFDIVQPLRRFLVNYLFKPFSPVYVIEIQNHLADLIRNLKNSGKVEDMTFDVQTNTNTNELIVNLYIKPIGAIEYITINLNVIPTTGQITTTQQ